MLAELQFIAVGSGEEQKELIAKTVNIIDEIEIRDRNEISLIGALATVPGFRVQQLGGFGRTASIKTRGLRNQDTAVLIDGFRVRDPAAITGDASPFLSDITLSSGGRIEVLRGSGSSVYGTNAIGGVIDFRSAEPKRGINGQFAGEYGSLGMSRYSGNMTAGTSDGKAGFTVGASRTAFTEGIDGEDDANNNSYRGRVDFNPFAKTHISGRFFISDAFVRLNSGPDTLGTLPGIATIITADPGANFLPDANDPDNLQRSDIFSGQISLTQIVDSKLVLTAGYQGLRTSRKNENGGRGSGFQPFGGVQKSTFDGQIHTLNAKAEWSPIVNNLVTVGYEFEAEKYGNEGVGPFASNDFLTRVNQSSNTIFVQNLLGLFGDRLQFAGGFRAQFFALELPVFSVNNAPYNILTLNSPPTSYTFDGATSYFFNSTGTKIRAHVGNGYRVPSLYERFGSFYSSFSQNFTALGDPNLKPERTIAFDAGLEQNLAGDRLRLSATYFYTKLINTIGYANAVLDIGSTARPFGGYFNNEGGIARGAEFSGDMKIFHDLSVFSSYTYTNSDQRESQVTGSGVLKTLGIADHQFSIVATKRFGSRFSLNFDFASSSSYLAPIFSNSIFSTRIYRFDGIRKGDLTGRYEIPVLAERLRLVLFGTLENAFGNEYYENGFRTNGRTGRVGAGFSF